LLSRRACRWLLGEFEECLLKDFRQGRMHVEDVASELIDGLPKHHRLHHGLQEGGCLRSDDVHPDECSSQRVSQQFDEAGRVFERHP